MNEVVLVNKSALVNETFGKMCKYGHETTNTNLTVSIACLYLAVGIAAFLSNLFIDYIIWKLELLRVVGHLFILSLSLSDLIQGILVSLVLTIELLTEDSTTYFRGQVWCRFSAGMSLLAILSTVYNIVLITLDRVIAIFLPFRYHELVSEKRAKIIIASLWIYMIIWCALPLLGWAKDTNCLRPANAICDWGVTLDSSYFLITGTLVATSVLLVAVLQSAMLTIAIRQMKAIRAQGRQGIRTLYTKQGKVTRKVSFIVLVFALTYLPWFFLVIRTVITGLGGQSYIYACNLLIFLNSFLNPWIYAATDRAIRKRMIQCIYNPRRTKVAPFVYEDYNGNTRKASIFSVAELGRWRKVRKDSDI